MPRPRRLRKVGLEPGVTYFKPAGIRMTELEESILTVDEFEAVRLNDLRGMGQEESAKKMDISQPTFHRIILSARKKIADAIVNGKAIRIEGGDFRIIGKTGPGGFCRCPKCGNQQSHVRGQPCTRTVCDKCGTNMVRG